MLGPFLHPIGFWCLGVIQAIILAHVFILHAVSAEEIPVLQRIQQRTFPSIFQAWNGATPTLSQNPDAMLARHDLVFLHPSQLGLVADEKHEGLAKTFTPTSLAQAQARRAGFLRANSNLILLAEVRYRDAPREFLPDDSPYWKRDANGEMVLGWAEGGYHLLAVEQTQWQDEVAKRAKALQATGIFDGVMLDWWSDDDAHVSLARRVREAVGPNALILVNSNDREIPRTASYVNGLFMKCYRSATPEDWKRISETLRWAEANLRSPRINCIETWFHQSRADLALMRAVTTLTLIQSDGYCLFSDPNDLPTPDHLHDWYPFWNKGLGQPQGSGRSRADGGWEREFSNGTVVYNPAGNPPIQLRFNQPKRSRATNRRALEHSVAPGDGDIFLRE